MSKSGPRRSIAPKFSLLNVLALTAFIAIGTAVALAYRRNRLMYQQRDELLTISSRLKILNVDELASQAMAIVADNFHSWQIHVPEKQDYELRLGIGEVSENGIPPIVGSVPVTAGRHRVTLHTADSTAEKFQYEVYLDGKLVIEQVMGSEWIPHGWSTASGLSWPQAPNFTPPPIQLSGQSYASTPDFGQEHNFNGQSDKYVTRNGYRLWIDLPNREVTPVSPFVTGDFDFYGFGLRDGLRYKSSVATPYDWTFIRPKSDTNDPVFKIAAEFFAEDGTILSSQTQAFQSWQLRSDVLAESPHRWPADTEQLVCGAFLHAKLKSDDAPQPVVEIRWDANRPEQLGLRLAEAPANDRIRKWRLRILDGAKHLWRQLQIGDRVIRADEVLDHIGISIVDERIAMDLGSAPMAETHLRWQTDETLPLQVLERKQKRYANRGLFQGLPLTFELQIPASLEPTLAATALKDDPIAPGNTFPGGTVFDEIQIELDASTKEWVWLTVKTKN